MLLTACAHSPAPDHPNLPANTTLHDFTFFSPALNRQMHYRAILPSGRNLPTLYLLHGGAGDFREWTTHAALGQITGVQYLLILPQGDYSYYVNAADPPADRYEDYLVNDLIADVERRFPAAPGRAHRAIAGVSMGGFGAIKLALSHPGLFTFAAALSPAIDVARRPYSLRRVRQYRAMEKIFGPWNSPTRRSKDPFHLVATVPPATAPYLYLGAGEAEGLLPAIRQFESLLQTHHIQHELQVLPGDHNWTQWNRHLPALLSAVAERFHPRSSAAQNAAPVNSIPCSENLSATVPPKLGFFIAVRACQ